jgi:uncharacterized protein YcfJ
MRLPMPAAAASIRLAPLIGALLGVLLVPGASAAVLPPVPTDAGATPAGDDATPGAEVIEEDAPKGAAEGLDEPGSPAWVSRVENVSYSYAQVLRVDPVAEDVTWFERVRQCPGDPEAASPAPEPPAAPLPPRPLPEPAREGRIATLFGSLVDGLMGRDAVVVLEEAPPAAPADPAAEPAAVERDAVEPAAIEPTPGPEATAGFETVPAEGDADADADATAAATGDDEAAPDGPDADGCTWVDVQQIETKVVAYDVEYRYRGDIYVSRMRHDPGARLRIRVAVSPADEPR